MFTDTERRTVKYVKFSLFFLLLPMTALADGKVFPGTALAETTIPDQRALLCWSNGVERLVIETRFTGAGTNFAWVVPLPSQPEIEEATTGLFTTLAHQLRPKVVHNPDPLFAVFLFCMAIGYLLLFVRKGPRRVILDFLACAAAAASLLFLSSDGAMFFFMLVIFGLLLLAVVRIRLGAERAYAIVLVLFFGAIFGSMLLPSLGTTGLTAVSGNLTEVASQRVGAFDTKTIAAKTPNALLDWLRENQFAVPTNAEPVVADYVKRGWVFVAAKLHRDDAAATTNSIHPLSFTFRTTQPVYPLRLTGVSNGPLRVELYVFGAERAEADHFKVERCAPVEFPEKTSWAATQTPEVGVKHPKLRQWVQGSSVATKLSATLAPEQMQNDVAIRWVPFAPHQEVLYSRKGAAITAANWAMGFILGLSSCAVIALAIKREWRWATTRIAAVVVGFGLLIFCVGYVALPKVPVHFNKLRLYHAQRRLEELGKFVTAHWEQSPPNSLAEARKAAVLNPDPITDNILLGGKIREDDSPGNYQIRQTTNGFEFLWFDRDGGEHVYDKTLGKTR
jgi:hypothetical protein